MGNGGNKKVKIKLKVKNGQLDKVTDENNIDAPEVDPAEMLQIHQNQGFTHLGVILQAQINPTCVFVCVRGKCYKICT